MVSSSTSHFVRNVDLLCYLIPDFIYTVSVIESFKDSIATNHDEVEVVLDFESGDIRFANNHIGVATVLWALCFYVSEGLGYAQSARKYSQWSLDVQILLAWMRRSLGKSLSSIDLASSCLDTDFFEFIVRFVISR